MKIGAHPLVVAVALGLLGPAALAEESEDRLAAERCDTCDGSCVRTCDDPAAAGEALADAESDPLSVMVAEAWSDMVSSTVSDAELG